MSIYAKLLKFQELINAIKKDGKNPHFKSTYATLPQILSEVKPVLSQLGLVLTQPCIDGHVLTIITDSETQENIKSSIELPDNVTPQQMCGAITYYRRYTLAGLMALEIEDDDGNEASQKPWLNIGTPEFDKAVEYLKEGNSITKIESKYGLSKKVRESLIAQSI